METIFEKLGVICTVYGLKVIGAIIILIVGRILAGMGRNVAKMMMVKSKADDSLVPFVGNLVYVLILTFAVLAALAKFGIQTASIVAVLAAAGFAVGLALQGSLANFASGVMILVFRPFKVGDVIEGGGVIGAVKEIQIFNTILTTPDNIKTIVPNGKIYSDTIKNITAYETRRVDMVIGIGYGSSIQKAYDVVSDLMKSEERILSDPAPQIAVAELADSSVNLVVRPWAKTEDYWGVKFDLTRAIKEAFDENGIEIPFPQQVVHMISADSEK